MFDFFLSVMKLEVHYTLHVDNAGFNLAKTPKPGRRMIGKRATVDDQRGANITMFAAISSAGLVL